MIPAFVKRKIEALTAAEYPPPILKLTTACDFEFGFSGLRIQSRPAITPAKDPLPEQFKIRTGTTLAFFARP